MAYSTHIIPGGENIGIEVYSEGILVIGFYKVGDNYNKNELKIGDRIIKVADEEVNTVDELVTLIDKYQEGGIVPLTI